MNRVLKLIPTLIRPVTEVDVVADATTTLQVTTTATATVQGVSALAPDKECTEIYVAPILDIPTISDCEVPEPVAIVQDCPDPIIPVAGRRGVAGTAGQVGATGPTGPCPSVTVDGEVTVTTDELTPPEVAITVVVTGSCAYDFDFDFTLPPGPAGADGAIGPVGPAGPEGPEGPCPTLDATGEVTVTSDPMTTPSVAITVTPGPGACEFDFDFDFTLPPPEINEQPCACPVVLGNPTADNTPACEDPTPAYFQLDNLEPVGDCQSPPSGPIYVANTAGLRYYGTGDVLEAHCHSTPVIASGVGGAPEDIYYSLSPSTHLKRRVLGTTSGAVTPDNATFTLNSPVDAETGSDEGLPATLTVANAAKSSYPAAAKISAIYDETATGACWIGESGGSGSGGDSHTHGECLVTESFSGSVYDDVTGIKTPSQTRGYLFVWDDGTKTWDLQGKAETARVVATVSEGTGADSAAIDLTWPGDVEANDIAVLYTYGNHGGNSNNMGESPGSEWELQREQEGGNFFLQAWTRELDGDETGILAAPFGASGPNGATLVIARGVRAAGSAFSSTSSSLSPGLTTESDNNLVLRAAVGEDAGNTPPSWTIDADIVEETTQEDVGDSGGYQSDFILCSQIVAVAGGAGSQTLQHVNTARCQLVLELAVDNQYKFFNSAPSGVDLGEGKGLEARWYLDTLGNRFLTTRGCVGEAIDFTHPTSLG